MRTEPFQTNDLVRSLRSGRVWKVLVAHFDPSLGEWRYEVESTDTALPYVGLIRHKVVEAA